MRYLLRIITASCFLLASAITGGVSWYFVSGPGATSNAWWLFLAGLGVGSLLVLEFSLRLGTILALNKMGWLVTYNKGEWSADKLGSGISGARTLEMLTSYVLEREDIQESSAAAA